MSDLFAAISTNFLSISIVLILIFTFQLGNMIFGIVNNVFNLKEDFSKDKIKKWFFKTILTLIGTFILSCGITLIPFSIEYINISIPEEYDILVNFGLIVLSAVGTLKNEINKCYENYKKCIENI